MKQFLRKAKNYQKQKNGKKMKIAKRLKFGLERKIFSYFFKYHKKRFVQVFQKPKNLSFHKINNV